MDLRPETGTLAELNVKPGDVVETCYRGDNAAQYRHTISSAVDGVYVSQDSGQVLGNVVPWRIVSRASQPDTPKLWRNMTPEEKGALLLAHHEGKVIEYFCHGFGWKAEKPNFFDWCAYRIRPDPKRETVTLHGNCDGSTWLNFGKRGPVKFDTHRITFDLIDGKPDIASIRMEEI